MEKISPEDYGLFISSALSVNCGRIYPLSIAEGIQKGDIFTDGNACLFHHTCGFAFTSGNLSNSFLEDIFQLMKVTPRRIVLFSENGPVNSFFRSRKEISAEYRDFYSYSGEAEKIMPLPEGYRMCRIDEGLIPKIRGRITPAFSWTSVTDFLSHGAGFCVTYGDEPAAWAFSAAVSSEEIDIGVETLPAHQCRGLSIAAAQEMVRYAIQNGKAPVWACHRNNIASARTAAKLGFRKSGECLVIKHIKEI